MIAFILQSATALLLILAGAQKLSNPSGIRQTMHGLGVPNAAAFTVPLALAELGVGAALVLTPANLITAVAVAVIGTVFVGAGVVAILRRVKIDCACLGSLPSSVLGWRQVALFPVWLVVAAVGVMDQPVVLPDQRPETLVILLAALSLALTAHASTLAHEHRTLRNLREAR